MSLPGRPCRPCRRMMAANAMECEARVQEEGGVGSPCLQYTTPAASCPHASRFSFVSSISGVDLGLEDANKRQPPVPLVIVQSIPDDERIRHLEARIINPHRHPSPGRLVQ